VKHASGMDPNNDQSVWLRVDSAAAQCATAADFDIGGMPPRAPRAPRIVVGDGVNGFCSSIQRDAPLAICSPACPLCGGPLDQVRGFWGTWAKPLRFVNQHRSVVPCPPLL
jgi:hypothetical protein